MTRKRGETKDRPGARFHGRVEGTGRVCDHPQCAEAGEFRAPPLEGAGGSDRPPRFRWFCLDHVRAFNAGYNFFDGMTADEIHHAQRPYAGWERETRAFANGGGDRGPRWADFTDPLDAIAARFRRTAAPERTDGKPLSGQDRESLKVLGLDADADRHALRKRYSELVRKYHPDRNGGDRSHEGMLQKVIAAYQQLRQAPAFA
ncbi:J domain-containing protein [Sphingomonas lenta]|uniref:Molecular chaperone DnaJ n=1 Tax=Sphingomonas lenta TaxID=1141887 RepID=A0A2A2SF69_9SPHN|nr:J domain-containing protein [Sphingomonas lenta]PAX07840.1 molecular chaperone DnaJ [Sphingomonas lenta]